MTHDHHHKDKSALRTHALRVRKGAREMLGVKAAEDAAKHGLSLLSAFTPGSVIGAYWPMKDELDPRFLMLALERAGYGLALPVVVAKDQALIFRRWGQGDPLAEGPYGTQAPGPDAPAVVPAAMIVPLLAFDADCYRTGWGGGYYDRTLAAHSEIKAFGFAYAAQFVDHMPHDDHDWPMQGVITETGVILPRKTADHHHD